MKKLFLIILGFILGATFVWYIFIYEEKLSSEERYFYEKISEKIILNQDEFFKNKYIKFKFKELTNFDWDYSITSGNGKKFYFITDDKINITIPLRYELYSNFFYEKFKPNDILIFQLTINGGLLSVRMHSHLDSLKHGLEGSLRRYEYLKNNIRNENK
jgi:hypothetical protein